MSCHTGYNNKMGNENHFAFHDLRNTEVLQETTKMGILRHSVLFKHVYSNGCTLIINCVLQVALRRAPGVARPFSVIICHLVGT